MNMTIQMPEVTVRSLPEKLNLRQRWLFFRELEEHMRHQRPRIVLDCSAVERIDKSVIYLLLRCLEEAIKCNGDVKLAAVSPDAKALFDFTGVSRLFEIFDTTAEAVNSFHCIPACLSRDLASPPSPRVSESAA